MMSFIPSVVAISPFKRIFVLAGSRSLIELEVLAVDPVF